MAADGHDAAAGARVAVYAAWHIALSSGSVAANRSLASDIGRQQRRWRWGSALPSKPYSRSECELILVQLLLDGVLREEFGHTMYTTISYLFTARQYGPGLVMLESARSLTAGPRAACLRGSWLGPWAGQSARGPYGASEGVCPVGLD